MKVVKLGGTTTVIPVSDVIASSTGQEPEMGDGTPMDM